MRQQVNLYHPIFRKQEKKFSAIAMLQGGATVLAGVLLIYGISWWQVGVLRARAAQVEQDYASTLKRLEDVTQKFPPKQPSAKLEDEVRKLEELLGSGQYIRDVLSRDVLVTAKGFSSHFVALSRQTLAGLWLTGVSIRGDGSGLTLEGRSNNPELVPQYLTRLANEDVLAGTQFQVFQINRPITDEQKKTLASYVEFTIKSAESNGTVAGRP